MLKNPTTFVCLVAFVLNTAAATARSASKTSRSSPTFVGKVWRSTDPSAAPGTLRIFLPGGTLVLMSCVEPYRLARWRSLGLARISWEEDAARIDADVVRVTASDLLLRLRLVNETKDERYELARVPYVCPDMRPVPAASDLHVKGTIIYFERLALPPSATVHVELRDSSRLDAPARVLAGQTIPASLGPPFRYSIRVPRSRIDPHANLSLFAEIRDGHRQMFATTSRYSVPLEGAAAQELHLTFMASAPGDSAPGVITPTPTAYACGDETFKVAFEAERAYVTLPDHSLVTLPLLQGGADRNKRRTFTNGRLTFVQEADGASESRVSFARGRMPTIPCTAGAGAKPIAADDQRVTVTDRPEERRVDVIIGGQPFTSYIYPANLEKPVL